MTLGIGFQGRDFALMLTDSLASVGVPEAQSWVMSKSTAAGDRLAWVISGKYPATDPPAVDGLSAIMAVRRLREWARLCNPFVGPHILSVGGHHGTMPRVAVAERIGPPRVAELGDLVVIGCCAVRAHELGYARNYGDVDCEQAAEYVKSAALALVDDLYEEAARVNGLDSRPRTLMDFANCAVVPTVAAPFHLFAIDANTATTTEIPACHSIA